MESFLVVFRWNAILAVLYRQLSELVNRHLQADKVTSSDCLCHKLFLQGDAPVEGVENPESKGDTSKTPPNTPDPRSAQNPEGIAPGLYQNHNLALMLHFGETHGDIPVSCFMT